PADVPESRPRGGLRRLRLDRRPGAGQAACTRLAPGPGLEARRPPKVKNPLPAGGRQGPPPDPPGKGGRRHVIPDGPPPEGEPPRPTTASARLLAVLAPSGSDRELLDAVGALSLSYHGPLRGKSSLSTHLSTLELKCRRAESTVTCRPLTC